MLISPTSLLRENTVNRIVMVRLANDVTIMLLFTFYFGHVTNKRDHWWMSIELQTLKSAHITHLFDFSYFTVLVFYKIDCEQLLRVYRRGNYAFIGCPADAKHKLWLFIPLAVSNWDGEHTRKLKQKAHEEWLRLILQTREMMPDHKKRLDLYLRAAF